VTADTRDRLIQAAGELLQERPYHAVGVKALCERAGVRKGSFYHYFSSKQELTIAAVDRAWEACRELVSSVALADGDLETAVREVVDACMRSPLVRSADRLIGCPFGRLAASVSDEEPLLATRLNEIFEEWEGLLEGLFGAGEVVARSTLAEIQGRLLLESLAVRAGRPASAVLA
jgi:TetR/AcrR family transcriptional repressor of nem operon